jgi:hypothetical protein
MDQLPSQPVQFLAPFLPWNGESPPAAFVEGASRETVHEWSQRMRACPSVFVYSFPIR